MSCGGVERIRAAFVPVIAALANIAAKASISRWWSERFEHRYNQSPPAASIVSKIG